jgi:hypothetical protein
MERFPGNFYNASVRRFQRPMISDPPRTPPTLLTAILLVMNRVCKTVLLLEKVYFLAGISKILLAIRV